MTWAYLCGVAAVALFIALARFSVEAAVLWAVLIWPATAALGFAHRSGRKR